jgi:hypothetical protein
MTDQAAIARHRQSGGERLMDRPLSCWGCLVKDELPEDSEDLPYEQKFEAHEMAVERATVRWHFTHPNNHHDAERWAQDTRVRSAI